MQKVAENIQNAEGGRDFQVAVQMVYLSDINASHSVLEVSRRQDLLNLFPVCQITIEVCMIHTYATKNRRPDRNY